MKILTYKNRKVDPYHWDASTPEKEAAALSCLFQVLDKDWQCFCHLNDDIDEYDPSLKDLLELKEQYEKGQVPKMFENITKEKLKSLVHIEKRAKKHKEEQLLYTQAKNGDFRSMKYLLNMYKGEEYSEWHFDTVEDPNEWLAKKHS